MTRGMHRLLYPEEHTNLEKEVETWIKEMKYYGPFVLALMKKMNIAEATDSVSIASIASTITDVHSS